jgi:hypothetical protein
VLRIVLDAGVVQLHDNTTTDLLAEPAAVAVDTRAGLPFAAGWAALEHRNVVWPFERLGVGELDADPEPRRCLLGHMVRAAVATRPWWDRILKPSVTLVVPACLSARSTRILRSDAIFSGTSRHVRLDVTPPTEWSVRRRPFPAE